MSSPSTPPNENVHPTADGKNELHLLSATEANEARIPGLMDNGEAERSSSAIAQHGNDVSDTASEQIGVSKSSHTGSSTWELTDAGGGGDTAQQRVVEEKETSTPRMPRKVSGPFRIGNDKPGGAGEDENEEREDEVRDDDDDDDEDDDFGDNDVQQVDKVVVEEEEEEAREDDDEEAGEYEFRDDNGEDADNGEYEKNDEDDEHGDGMAKEDEQGANDGHTNNYRSMSGSNVASDPQEVVFSHDNTSSEFDTSPSLTSDAQHQLEDDLLELRRLRSLVKRQKKLLREKDVIIQYQEQTISALHDKIHSLKYKLQSRDEEAYSPSHLPGEHDGCYGKKLEAHESQLQKHEQIIHSLRENYLDIESREYGNILDSHAQKIESLQQELENLKIAITEQQQQQMPSGDIEEVGPSHQMVIIGYLCDSCREHPVGVRYNCRQCIDYDLCKSCFEDRRHDEGHTFSVFDAFGQEL